MGREAINHRAAWITEPQELGDFVEGLSGRVVARASDIFVAPGLALFAPPSKDACARRRLPVPIRED